MLAGHERVPQVITNGQRVYVKIMRHDLITVTVNMLHELHRLEGRSRPTLLILHSRSIADGWQAPYHLNIPFITPYQH